jgi:probable F420-dependent oxidoreductase
MISITVPVKPFRFGVQLKAAGNGKGWADLARRVEGLGYDVLTIPDHFGDQLAPVPALAVAAASTSRLRVGAFVFANDYKHPVVLAKEMATLDVLSDGRFEASLGAGWAEPEYRQAGIAFDESSIRVDRLTEAIEIVTGLLRSPDPVTFNGSHYQLHEMVGWPRPVQMPGPPLLIGAARPRMLRLAAQKADIVGINVELGAAGTNTIEGVAARLARVREAAGDRFADLELNIAVLQATVTDDVGQRAAQAGAWLKMSADEVLESPHFLVGSVNRVTDRLLELRERLGLSYFVVVGEESMDSLAPVVARLAGT